MKIMAGWILQFKDLNSDLSIDIMVNKRAEVLNSILIHQYCELDSRFQQLAKFLKKWNQQLQLNKHDQLNNYSLCLMLLSYMQSKKLIPNLQGDSWVQFPIWTDSGTFDIKTRT